MYTQPPTIRQSLICDPGFRFALRRQFQILCVPEEFSVPQQLRKKRLLLHICTLDVLCPAFYCFASRKKRRAQATSRFISCRAGKINIVPGYFDIRRTLCSLSEMLSTTTSLCQSLFGCAGLHTGAALCTNKGASAPGLIHPVSPFFCSAEYLHFR